jgi:serine/threonine-protein kinase
MSAIYRARDEETGREVALKVLPPEFAENPIRLKRFFREARAAAKLQHENIVAVYDYGYSGGVYYIAMELVEGQDLHAHVAAQGPLPSHEAIEILNQAARALSHAYFQGIVHRDVKPSNLLVAYPPPAAVAPSPDRRTPLVKLTDFGLALDWTSLDESRLTRHGTTLGTVDYMAPEQARGTHIVDTRSDLYGLGCTCYFMLTGRAPFPEGDVPDKLYKHVFATPADPREFNARIPDGLITVLGKLLQKRPQDRYQTPAELLVDLDRLKEATRIRPAPPPVPDPALTETPRSSSPLERPTPPPATKPPPARIPDVQPGWSVVAERVSEVLVYLSDPWVLTIGMAGILLVVIFFLLRNWPG